MTRHCARWWYWYRHPIFAAQYTTEDIDSKITPPRLTKLTGGGPTDPGDDATIWCQLAANQRPGFRSRDPRRPIRGQLTTSPWRGVNQSQILIFCSSARQATQATAHGERSRIETCEPAEKIGKYPFPFHFYLPSLQSLLHLDCYSWFCLVKNVCVIVSSNSSRNWVSFICQTVVNHTINSMRQILAWDSIIPQLLSRAKHWVISSWITLFPTSRHSQVCSMFRSSGPRSLIAHQGLATIKNQVKFVSQVFNA